MNARSPYPCSVFETGDHACRQTQRLRLFRLCGPCAGKARKVMHHYVALVQYVIQTSSSRSNAPSLDVQHLCMTLYLWHETGEPRSSGDNQQLIIHTTYVTISVEYCCDVLAHSRGSDTRYKSLCLSV